MTETAQEAGRMPLYYGSLVPLMRAAHRDVAFHAETADYRFAAASNGIPITLDEIAIAQAHYPIVFSAGEMPIPYLLAGGPGEGNRFIDAEGNWRRDTYIPAYVRRYPFFLAKLESLSDQLTLCFDPAAASIRHEAGGGNLFAGDGPSDTGKAVLQFCEQFELSAQKTQGAMAELVRLGLLIDGEAKIRRGEGEPAVFRGFQIVAEDKLHRLPGADFAVLVKCGAMALIYAHLFSLRHVAQFVS